jgi:WD repeat-containing protein 35
MLYVMQRVSSRLFAGTVQVVAWNPHHKKLTTADSTGLIIVLLLHKGTWFEEMINNRGKSVVADMRWRSNGEEICIAYQDGHVIVGTVDGNRVWSKDVGALLTHVEWAPDGRWLLFGTGDGPLMVYSHQGAKIGNLELQAIADIGAPVKLLSVEWYDGAEGYIYPDVPCLAIAFVNGRVQIMREADDPKPVLLDSGLRLTQCRWNTSGSVLALAGTRVAGGKESSEVQFYTPFG